MTLVGFYGAEAGILGEVPYSGTCSISSTVKKTGDYSFRANPATTANGYGGIYALGATGLFDSYYNVDTGYHEFDFRVDTLPAANHEEICAIYTTGTGSRKMSVDITNAGKLQVYDAGNTGGPFQLGSDSATALSTGTQYHIGVKCGNGANAAYEVTINGVSEISGTGNVRAGACGAFLFGKVTNRHGNSVDYYYDNVTVDDAGYVGEVTVLRLDPAGDGTYTTWTPNSGANPDYQYVDDPPAYDTTTYLLSTLTIGDASTVTLETLANAGYTGGAILGVRADFYITRDGGGSARSTFRLRSGTTNLDTSSAYAMGGSSYYSFHMFTTTDPATSAAWTVAGVNGVEIGCIEGNSAIPKVRWTASYLMVCIAPSTGMGQVI